jgi:hypothetical protein
MIFIYSNIVFLKEDLWIYVDDQDVDMETVSWEPQMSIFLHKQAASD